MGLQGIYGYYYQWAPAGPYTLTVTADNHVPDVTTAVVNVGQSTYRNFNLRLFAPCLMLEPETISVTLSTESQLTTTLSIINSGAGDLTWAMRETTDTIALPPSLPPFTGERPQSNEPLSIMPLNLSASLAPSEPDGPLSPLFGEPAYALDTFNFDLVHIPNTAEPGTWDIISNIGSFYSGADFWHGDFSKLYAIDFDSSELVILDTTTGAKTVIGVADAFPGHSWTGLTAATDGTLYGVSTVCGTVSTLYTINRITAEASPVGSTNLATCLIDIAINAEGEMYGIDIKDDVLVQIDPATGASSTVGYLGIDANNAQSIDFEEESGILYWAAVDYRGHLRRIDTASGNSLAIGDFPGGAGVDGLAFATGGGDPLWSDVPWVTEVPTSGVTLADSDFEVDVVLDTTGLAVDECYEASLGLLHDDGQHEEPALVPLTLCTTSDWPVFYLEKSVSPLIINPGDLATYTIIFGNDGSLETGITISDVLPSEVEYAWSDPSGIYNGTEHQVVWPNLTLDQGSRFTTTVVVTVSEAIEPGTWLTNTANLIWRDEIMTSSWAGFSVGEGQYKIFLPVVVHNSGAAQANLMPFALPVIVLWLGSFWLSKVSQRDDT